MHRWCALIAVILCCVPAAAQDQYLCVKEQSAGFAFEAGQWRSTTFRAEGNYVVRRRKEDDSGPQTAKWLVLEVGERVPLTWCANDFNEYGRLDCDDGLFTWTMFKNTLRFMATYLVGYLDGADDNANTPHMFIGKCAAL